MVQINFAKREVSCKVVFYGPAQSGKTANLRSIHERSPENVRGALTTIATDTDRTLFFDYLPLNLGLVAGIGTKINLYAVPYIANQNPTRLLVLEGSDGIVFVADSSSDKMVENIEALRNLRENLADLGRDLADIPIVFQWNKSDAPDRLTAEQLNAELNAEGHPAFDTNADTGVGVFTGLKAITQKVLLDVSQMMATPAKASLPVAAPEPEPVQTPEPEPVQAPEPEPVHVPESEPVHVPEPEPVREPESEPVVIRPQPGLAAAETDPEPVFEEQEEPTPVEVARAEEAEQLDVAVAEYEQAFGATGQPPSAVMEAAQSLAQPGNYQKPPPVFAPRVPAPPAKPAVHEAARAEPEGPRMVSVGGRTAPSTGRAEQGYSDDPSWEGELGDPETNRRRATRPVTDRRQSARPADSRNVVPVANFVAGAVCTLVSLTAIGYLVLALL